MQASIQNRVAESGLVTIDLAQFLPGKGEIIPFDLSNFLYRGLILREKEYRESLQDHDWRPYQNALVAVHCSADAIIPAWAYMLAVTHLNGIARYVQVATVREMEESILIEAIRSMPTETFKDGRVVVKGCGDREIGPLAYGEITRLLQPIVKSLMYGEPCSTVPIYKRKA